jgi:hypothetical protein
MQCKLNPNSSVKVNFPGFQEILDFTSAGSESSVSVTVDGDTDKEYKIVIRGIGADLVWLRLDGATSGYGSQYLMNNAGTITSARATNGALIEAGAYNIIEGSLLTPTGFIKTFFSSEIRYSSGTTIGLTFTSGWAYNSTSNITTMDFIASNPNFASGTRITVYARRSNV